MGSVCTKNSAHTGEAPGRPGRSPRKHRHRSQRDSERLQLRTPNYGPESYHGDRFNDSASSQTAVIEPLSQKPTSGRAVRHALSTVHTGESEHDSRERTCSRSKSLQESHSGRRPSSDGIEDKDEKNASQPPTDAPQLEGGTGIKYTDYTLGTNVDAKHTNGFIHSGKPPLLPSYSRGFGASRNEDALESEISTEHIDPSQDDVNVQDLKDFNRKELVTHSQNPGMRRAASASGVAPCLETGRQHFKDAMLRSTHSDEDLTSHSHLARRRRAYFELPLRARHLYRVLSGNASHPSTAWSVSDSKTPSGHDSIVFTGYDQDGTNFADFVVASTTTQSDAIGALEDTWLASSNHTSESHGPVQTDFANGILRVHQSSHPVQPVFARQLSGDEKPSDYPSYPMSEPAKLNAGTHVATVAGLTGTGVQIEPIAEREEKFVERVPYSTVDVDGQSTFTRKMLDSIMLVQTQFIQNADVHTLFSCILDQFMSLGGAGAGFVSEVHYDKHHRPYMVTHAVMDETWDAASRSVYARYRTAGFMFSNLQSLYGLTLRFKQTIFSDDPAHDPRGGGLPPGHPALHNYCGIPLLVGARLVGMVGLSNRTEGFNAEFVDTLRPMINATAGIIDAFKAKQRQKVLYKKARHQKALLETEVRNRTRALEAQTAELNAVTHTRQQFFYKVVHEVRNPLMSIIVNATELKEMNLSGEQSECLEDILIAVEMLRVKVNEILKYGKLQAGKMHLQQHLFNMRLLNMQLVAMFKSMAKQKNAVLDICLSEAVPQFIVTDIDKLFEVVVNYVSNAIKYCSHRIHISISASHVGQRTKNGAKCAHSECPESRSSFERRVSGASMHPMARRAASHGGAQGPVTPEARSSLSDRSARSAPGQLHNHQMRKNQFKPGQSEDVSRAYGSVAESSVGSCSDAEMSPMRRSSTARIPSPPPHGMLSPLHEDSDAQGSVDTSNEDGEHGESHQQVNYMDGNVTEKLKPSSTNSWKLSNADVCFRTYSGHSQPSHHTDQQKEEATISRTNGTSKRLGHPDSNSNEQANVVDDHSNDSDTSQEGRERHNSVHNSTQSVIDARVQPLLEFDPDWGGPRSADDVSLIAASRQIEVRPYHAAILIEVQDDGEGITPDVVKALFNPYVQAGDVGGKSVEGTGLGLAIVQELSVIFRGDAWVCSTPGRGSRFNFMFPARVILDDVVPAVKTLCQNINCRLPARPSRAQIRDEAAKLNINLDDVLTADSRGAQCDENGYNPKENRSTMLSPRFGSNKFSDEFDNLRFIVADDSTLNRKTLIRALMRSGVSHDAIRQAEDGSEILEMMAESPADIVLSDLHMRNVHGEDVARILLDRALVDSTPEERRKAFSACIEDDVPFAMPYMIIVTGDEWDHVAHLTKVGIRGYVQKGEPNAVQRALHDFKRWRRRYRPHGRILQDSSANLSDKQTCNPTTDKS